MQPLRDGEEESKIVKIIVRESRIGLGVFSTAKGRGLWQQDGDHVYIRCLSCNRILEIDWEAIHEDGTVHPCIVCGDHDYDYDDGESGCLAHLWVKLGGFWDKKKK